MRALVLGGYGAVGHPLVMELRRHGATVMTAGRDPRRADVVVDLADPTLTSYRAALGHADVVVNASGSESPRLAGLATAAGAAFVDISATTAYIGRLEQLSPARPVILNVGLAPGLTSILATDTHRRAPGAIDIAVLLGAGDRHGPAATDWSLGLLGTTFRSGGRDVRNYTEPLRFDLPGLGERRLYRVDFADQHTLTRDLGVEVRTYFGLDSRAATTALAALTRLSPTWIGATSRALRRLHPPGSDRWLVAARAESGTLRYVHGHDQSRATATLAAAAALRSGSLPPGVHHLHEILPATELPSALAIEAAGRAGHVRRRGVRR